MSILEHKCSTAGCWHRRTPGYIYCNHCLHGGCIEFTEEQKADYRDELRQANRDRPEVMEEAPE